MLKIFNPNTELFLKISYQKKAKFKEETPSFFFKLNFIIK